MPPGRGFRKKRRTIPLTSCQPCRARGNLPKTRLCGRLGGIPKLENVNWLTAALTLAAAIGSLQIFHQIRARAMRALAARRDFRYLGPPPPSWWWRRSRPTTRPPIPTGLRISRVWNVTEGKKDGFTVLIFDAILGEGRGAQFCTLVFYQTEWISFEPSTQAIRVLKKQGWTVLYGVWFLWFCWTMSVKRLDRLISQLEER
ncbi:MAG: hypothetical protein QOH35_1118 [Acidobacteriaceae bacterium]|jgi:hypothetical protein|nr:hypothetical protein [Acidobacteriaceae bacterium]